MGVADVDAAEVCSSSSGEDAALVIGEAPPRGSGGVDDHVAGGKSKAAARPDDISEQMLHQPPQQRVASTKPRSGVATQLGAKLMEINTKPSQRAADTDLPPGWVRKESKTKPGTYYYAHSATGRTQFKHPGRALGRTSLYLGLPQPTPLQEEGQTTAAGETGTAQPANLSEAKRLEGEAMQRRIELEHARKLAQRHAHQKRLEAEEALQKAEAAAKAEEEAQEEVLQRAREKRHRGQALEAGGKAEKERADSEREEKTVKLSELPRDENEGREALRRRVKAAGLFFGPGQSGAKMPDPPEPEEEEALPPEPAKKKEKAKKDKGKKKKLSKKEKQLLKKIEKEKKMKRKIKKAEKELRKSKNNLRKLQGGGADCTTSSSSSSSSGSSGGSSSSSSSS